MSFATAEGGCRSLESCPERREQMREGTIWKEKELQSAQISDFCRGRLLSYADTLVDMEKEFEKYNENATLS